MTAISTFDFNANGIDRLFFADLYIYLKKYTELPANSADEYIEALITEGGALSIKHESSVFAGPIIAACWDILEKYKLP